MAAIPAILIALQVAEDLRDRFASRNDIDLIMQLMSPNCGGLSKMAADVEGCFRRYIRDAVCRWKDTMSYISLRYRLEECFQGRSKHPCNDWFLPVDACEKADAGFFWNRLDDFELIKKLLADDCGGLSKMSKNVEGCFRKYVGEAIDHQHRSDFYLRFVERFVQCFSNRPELSCDDVIFRTSVFS